MREGHLNIPQQRTTIFEAVAHDHGGRRLGEQLPSTRCSAAAGPHSAALCLCSQLMPLPVVAMVLGLVVVLAVVFLATAKPKKFLIKEKQQLTLTRKEYISHDTLHLTFTLPKSTPVLGLPTGKHFKIFAPNVAGQVAGEWNGREDVSADEPEIHRMYTPVTSDRDLGKVELVLKEYKGGVNEKCEL